MLKDLPITILINVSEDPIKEDYPQFSFKDLKKSYQKTEGNENKMESIEVSPVGTWNKFSHKFYYHLDECNHSKLEVILSPLIAA